MMRMEIATRRKPQVRAGSAAPDFKLRHYQSVRAGGDPCLGRDSRGGLALGIVPVRTCRRV